MVAPNRLRFNVLADGRKLLYKEPMMDLPAKTPQVSPTVARIVAALAERIRAGVYASGDWLPSERELGADFNVSRILIRSAIKELERQRLLVCAPNRRPVVNRPEAIDGRAGVVRRSLAAWLWPNATWPPNGAILGGIQSALGNEFRLVLGSPVGVNWEENYASEARFLRQVLADRDIEGLILGYMGGERNLPCLAALREADIAMVFLDHLPPAGFDADYVGVDNRYGSELAMTYLLEQGHRRIAYVANYDTISTVEERLSGYRHALDRAGVDVSDALIRRDPGPPGNDPEEGCEQIVADLFHLADPPTAICAVNDIVAFRVMSALRRRHLRVPEDVAVIGFDGIERWAPSSPFLTTVYQPFERIGQRAVELLLERIKHGSSSPAKHVILDVELAVHRSSRPIPTGPAARYSIAAGRAEKTPGSY